MRAALLVAMREYAENAKTKGFWIGIFLLPVIFGLSITIQTKLDESTPTRHFVLVDQSGEFEAVIDAGLDRLHQRDILKELSKYVRANAERGAEGAEQVDLEDIPAVNVDEMIDEFSASNPGALDMFVEQGGIEAALRRVGPALREDAPEFEDPRRRFTRIDAPQDVDVTADLDTLAEQLKPYLRGKRDAGEGVGSLFAAILIPSDIEERLIRPGAPPRVPGADRQAIQYWAINLADDSLEDEVLAVVNEEVRRREYLRVGVDAEAVSIVQRTRAPLVSLNPKKEVGREEVSLADQIRQWAPVGFVYLLWIGIFTISQMLLNNTIEEKSNRIIEVLLSSVTARELMLGKLAGIAAIGLTMLTAWIGSGVAVLAYKAGPQADWATQALGVLQTSGLLPKFAIYFLLGYLMYSGIFLAIGSLCTTLKEAQNLMGPVMLIMIVPLFTMMFIPKNPNGTLATVLSWIPLYTPFVMMNRAAADPPMFDVVGTLILLLATTLLVLWLSGKIFRVGILRTGQPPKLVELLRWIRA
ncbi:MAG: ABC transporter permease [bacterium]|nr:ABC transporter permease [bacterium]